MNARLTGLRRHEGRLSAETLRSDGTEHRREGPAQAERGRRAMPEPKQQDRVRLPYDDVRPILRLARNGARDLAANRLRAPRRPR
jgi:hypothetical protein